jgi:hypothetical protein
MLLNFTVSCCRNDRFGSNSILLSKVLILDGVQRGSGAHLFDISELFFFDFFIECDMIGMFTDLAAL